jgi:hypothetical protein
MISPQAGSPEQTNQIPHDYEHDNDNDNERTLRARFRLRLCRGRVYRRPAMTHDRRMPSDQRLDDFYSKVKHMGLVNTPLTLKNPRRAPAAPISAAAAICIPTD